MKKKKENNTEGVLNKFVPEQFKKMFRGVLIFSCQNL